MSDNIMWLELGVSIGFLNLEKPLFKVAGTDHV